MSQDAYKIAKIHHVSVSSRAFFNTRSRAGTTIPEKGMNDPIPKRINSQFWDSQKVFSGQIAFLLLVQAGKSTPQTFNLIARN